MILKASLLSLLRIVDVKKKNKQELDTYLMGLPSTEKLEQRQERQKWEGEAI